MPKALKHLTSPYLCTGNEVWYWRLYFSSKSTIVSLLYHTIALCTILHLDNGWSNPLSLIELILCT
jgi:hypothetical protein